MLELVVLARDRPHHLFGDGVEKIDTLLGLRIDFEIDHFNDLLNIYRAWISLSSPGSFQTSSDRGESLQGRKAARVAQPHLDRILADVAVTAEHLHRVVGHLERRSGDIVAREIALL